MKMFSTNISLSLNGEADVNVSKALGNFDEIRSTLELVEPNDSTTTLKEVVSSTEVDTTPKPNNAVQVSKFLQLPIEIRQMIYVQYIHEVRHNLHRHTHYDGFLNPCCMWEWPRQLILCDKSNNTIPPPAFAYFLPPFCFANRQLRDEVAKHMLRHTEEYVFKYYEVSPVKITKYFTQFLEAITSPGDNAFAYIRYINLPHIHRYNGVKEDGSNPDVTLITRCTCLNKIRMTFYAAAMNKYTDDQEGARVHRSIDEILDYFGLRPILECKSLDEFWLDGIYPHPSYGFPGDPLKPLDELGWWIKTGFAEKSKDVKVFVRHRPGGWVEGTEGFEELKANEVS